MIWLEIRLPMRLRLWLLRWHIRQWQRADAEVAAYFDAENGL